MRECDNCDGTGEVEETCGPCRGTGVKHTQDGTMVDDPCPDCAGDGQAVFDCPECEGLGTIEDDDDDAD